MSIELPPDMRDELLARLIPSTPVDDANRAYRAKISGMLADLVNQLEPNEEHMQLMALCPPHCFYTVPAMVDDSLVDVPARVYGFRVAEGIKIAHVIQMEKNVLRDVLGGVLIDEIVKTKRDAWTQEDLARIDEYCGGQEQNDMLRAAFLDPLGHIVLDPRAEMKKEED